MVCLLFGFLVKGISQPDEDKLGAWYMYFWSGNLGEKGLGIQGDFQYRNWNLGGDLEQLLLRGGLTYTPEHLPVKFTLGYGNVRTGEYGAGGVVNVESRIYQEALIPQKLNNRVSLVHRFRYEQRFVEGQDFRTRWRYNFFINVLLNKSAYTPGAIYLAFYNELFINGEREIGGGRTVELFDRNRAYLALGYTIQENLKMQLGVMKQTTDPWEKDQVQLSLHHNF